MFTFVWIRHREWEEGTWRRVFESREEGEGESLLTAYLATRNVPALASILCSER